MIRLADLVEEVGSGRRIPEVTEEAASDTKPFCRSPGGGKQMRFAWNKGGAMADGGRTALGQA